MAEPTIAGSPSYENWKASLAQTQPVEAREFPLFTDAWILGDAPIGLGPYALFNTVVVPRIAAAAPRMILRVEYHPAKLPVPELKPNENAGAYHGGWIEDEIGALISLLLGIRVKAGGCTRRFVADGDPRGVPTAPAAYQAPQFARSGLGTPMIPNAATEHELAPLSQLAKLPQVGPTDSIALIRAARLYQDGLWVAESEPHLSWVLLVSSIEVAAFCWRTQAGTPEERLASAHPELEAEIKSVGGPDLVKKVATTLNPDTNGATKRFIDFILEFMPPPPEDRTKYAQFQIPWTREYFKKSMNTIYAWRSMALHAGIPFPLPMCRPPVSRGAARTAEGKDKHWGDGAKKQTYEERSAGLSAAGLGGAWRSKHTPMLLHVFEFVTRNALLRWWNH